MKKETTDSKQKQRLLEIARKCVLAYTKTPMEGLNKATLSGQIELLLELGLAHDDLEMVFQDLFRSRPASEKEALVETWKLLEAEGE